MLAKNVYNEYITDRHHVHMNSTKWLTLTEFVKYLGKTGEPSTAALRAALSAALRCGSVFAIPAAGSLPAGQCKVDETEKGWFITLIHKARRPVRGTQLRHPR